MIAALNSAVDAVEAELATDPSSAGRRRRLAARLGTTEHHLRRMFSSLAGMPLSEYVRRRRMSLAAADCVAGDDDLLAVAVRYGYGSTEAFGRAFRAVHGAGAGRRTPRRRSAPHTTADQVPPDRAREEARWTPASPTCPPAARRPRRARAARARGREPARSPSTSPSIPVEETLRLKALERHRAVGRARRQRRPRPGPRRGHAS